MPTKYTLRGETLKAGTSASASASDSAVLDPGWSMLLQYGTPHHG